MLKNKFIYLVAGIFALMMSPLAAMSATDLAFEEGHFRYSKEALANAQKEIKIVDINVSMNRTDASILFLKDPNDKSTFAASFALDGQEFNGRIKSFGSSTRALKKKSVILKLKGAKWKGYKNIALKSMSSDGSLMREYMAWELMRDMGMMVPETYYVRLNINGTFIGYFLYIEWLGKNFLDTRGYDAASEMYQPDDAVYCGDFRHGSDIERCWNKYTQDGKDYSSLKTLSKQIQAAPVATFDKFVAEKFEDDSLVNWMATNTLTSDGDTYNKNYFMVKSGATKKWKVIPWDYDLTFGQSFDMFVPFPESIFNERFQYYYTPDLGVFNPMKAKALLNENLKAKLYTRIKHLIGKEKSGSEKTFGWFSPTVMSARVEHLAKVLEGGQVRQKYGKRSATSFIEQYDAVEYYGIARPFYIEANMFSTFEWNYRNTSQMREYVAYTKGVDITPESIAEADAEEAVRHAALVAEADDAINPIGVQKKGLDEHEFMAKLLEKPFTGRGVSGFSNKSLIVYDPGFGYVLARLDFKEKFRIADFQAEAEAFKPPMYVYSEGNPEQCIQRSWVLFSRIPSLNIKADVTLEYFDEHSQKNELGGIKDERKVNLWMHAGDSWTPLLTEVNQKANTLTVNNFRLQAGRIYRFIACSSAESALWSKPVSR